MAAIRDATAAVKFSFNGVVRRIPIQAWSSETIESVRAHAIRLFGKTVEGYELFYEDSDHDKVTVGSTEELHEAFLCAKEQGKVLKIFVQDKEKASSSDKLLNEVIPPQLKAPFFDPLNSKFSSPYIKGASSVASRRVTKLVPARSQRKPWDWGKAALGSDESKIMQFPDISGRDARKMVVNINRYMKDEKAVRQFRSCRHKDSGKKVQRVEFTPENLKDIKSASDMTLEQRIVRIRTFMSKFGFDDEALRQMMHGLRRDSEFPKVREFARAAARKRADAVNGQREVRGSEKKKQTKRGILEPSRLRVLELQKELAQRGLTGKGNKTTLVARLTEALEEEEEEEAASLGLGNCAVMEALHAELERAEKAKLSESDSKEAECTPPTTVPEAEKRRTKRSRVSKTKEIDPKKRQRTLRNKGS